MNDGTKWSLRFSLCLLGFVATLAWANPYADVDWERWQQHRANLHTHTTMSDGRLTPAETIDCYRELGYTVLALTDHDTVGPGTNYEDPKKAETTWPWQRFQRDPAALRMVAVEGNEVSQVHHICSYFTGYGNPDVKSEEQVLDEIGQRGGLAVVCHPGRYDYPPDWYCGLLSRFRPSRGNRGLQTMPTNTRGISNCGTMFCRQPCLTGRCGGLQTTICTEKRR